MTYGELHEQVMRDVLHKRLPNGEYAYYNGLISAKVYRERAKNPTNVSEEKDDE